MTERQPARVARTRAKPAVVAAATRILPSDKSEAEKARRRRQEWQPLAWDYYDLIGEVKYSCGFVGNALSKLRLYAAEIDDPEDEPIATTNEDAIAALERIKSPAAGHAEIMRGLGVNLMVVGECYLVGLTAGRTEQTEVWEVRSTDELQPDSNGKYVLRDVPGNTGISTGEVALTDEDFILRIWTRHARYASLADSSLHGVLASCEELLILERAVRSAGRSRITGPGVLLVPSELSFGQGPDPTSDPGDGEAPVDPFISELMTAMMTPIQDEDNASAVVPMVVRGAAEHLKEFRHVSLDRPIDAMLDTRTDRALRRLAQGLDIPPEVVLGLVDVNHWTSWQIDEATFKAHVEPKAIVALDALTQGYMRPVLESAGVPNPERYVVWYDATKLVVRPNRGEDAKYAYTEKAIGGKALRRSLDFSERDKPSNEELQLRLAMDATRIDPFVQSQLLRDSIAPEILIPNPPGGTLDPNNPPGPVPDNSPAPSAPPNIEHPVPPQPSGNPPVNPGPQAAHIIAAGSKQRDWQRISKQLVEGDRALRMRIHVAADAAMQRALDRVGASLRSKTRKDRQLAQTIATTPQDEVAAVLGPTLVSQLGFDEREILQQTFERLGTQVERWIAATQRSALQVLDILPQAKKETLAEHQRADRERAVQWMQDALMKLAHNLLYDPHPAAPTVGEFDDTVRIPFGLARATVARAGGAAGMSTIRAAAEVDYGVVMEAGTEPAGGIGTGQEIIDALEEEGVTNQGYVWVYGAFPRSHPFEPHELLDGLAFANFDDDLLLNEEGWPEYAYYMPGDHDGCVCDFDIDLQETNFNPYVDLANQMNDIQSTYNYNTFVDNNQADLFNAIQDWTSSGSRELAMASRELIGEFPPGSIVFEGTQERAAAMLKLIDAAPPNAPTLYRGTTVTASKQGGAATLAAIRKGEAIPFGLASFSESENIAQSFGMSSGYGDRWSIFFRVEPGAKAVRLTPISTHSHEKEWLVQGQFRIVEVTEDVARQRYDVLLQQIATYDVS